MAAIAPVRPRPANTAAPVEVVEPPPGAGWWRRPRLHLAGLLVATAFLYMWNLSASGYGNSFYAAAVQAGTKSWKAFFFGSLDAGNAITVDKPPASLWVMELSGRIFGFNSWSLLLPQALEGVGAVALLYLAVRRVSGHGAGLLAGAALAVTPAAVLMFRFDNPDALLVLLLVAAAYAMTRAIETASTRWMLLVGTLLGFGFLTKMGQAFLILPGLALAYLVCAPTPLRRRIVALLLGGAAVVLSAGWYVGVVALVPAADRPYIAGSGNDSVLGLALGYNGLGRLFGGSGNGGGGGGSASASGTSFGGAAGLSRLFSNEFGLEVSWLLPASLVALVAGLVITLRRRSRTDRALSGLIVWGGWLLGTGVVLSYMEGTVHPYYTVALAPGIAACVAIGGQLLWSRRSSWLPRAGLLAMVIVTAAWTEHLLASDSTFVPALRWLVALGAAAFVGAVLVGSRLAAHAVAARRLTAAVAVSGVLIASGTAAWGVATASVAHTGSIPTTGPASASSGGMGGGVGGSAPTGTGGGTRTGGFGGGTAPSGTRPTGTRPTGAGGSAPTGTAGGSTASGTTPSGTTPSGTTGTPAARTGGGTGGGMGGGSSAALTALLAKTTTKWAAATVGATGAAGYELASGKSVIAIGGWNGSDNAPTLAQFEAMVKAGQISYLIAGGGMGGGGGGGGGSNSAITTWVAAHYTASTVGGTTVYNLTVAAK